VQNCCLRSCQNQFCWQFKAHNNTKSRIAPRSSLISMISVWRNKANWTKTAHNTHTHTHTHLASIRTYARPVVWLRVEHWAYWRPQLVVAEWTFTRPLESRQQLHVFSARSTCLYSWGGVIAPPVADRPTQWRQIHRARGHIPPLLQLAGHREYKNSKQEPDQTVLTKALTKTTNCTRRAKTVEGTTSNVSRATCAPAL